MDEGGAWVAGSPPVSIGTRMFLNVAAGRHQGTFVTHVEDMTEGLVWVAMPIRRGQLVVLDQGEAVTVEQPDRLGIYRWETTVKDRRVSGVPLLALARPARHWRGQRRLFFRLAISLPVVFAVLDSTGLPPGPAIPGLGVAYASGSRLLSGVTVDMSGGGILLQTDHHLGSGTRIDLEIALPAGRFVHATGEVVRAVRPLAKQGTQYGVRFAQVSSRDLEAIVRLVWQEQQARRRSGRL